MSTFDTVFVVFLLVSLISLNYMWQTHKWIRTSWKASKSQNEGMMKDEGWSWGVLLYDRWMDGHLWLLSRFCDWKLSKIQTYFCVIGTTIIYKLGHITVFLFSCCFAGIYDWILWRLGIFYLIMLPVCCHIDESWIYFPFKTSVHDKASRIFHS